MSTAELSVNYGSRFSAIRELIQYMDSRYVDPDKAPGATAIDFKGPDNEIKPEDRTPLRNVFRDFGHKAKNFIDEPKDIISM